HYLLLSCHLSVLPRLPLRPPTSTLFPYTTLFRSVVDAHLHLWDRSRLDYPWMTEIPQLPQTSLPEDIPSSMSGAVVIEAGARTRSEEHTSELQSRFDLVCRLLLEKKKETTVEVVVQTTGKLQARQVNQTVRPLV